MQFTVICCFRLKHREEEMRSSFPNVVFRAYVLTWGDSPVRCWAVSNGWQWNLGLLSACQDQTFAIISYNFFLRLVNLLMIYILVLYMLESAIAPQLLMGVIYYYCTERANKQQVPSLSHSEGWRQLENIFLIDLTCLIGVKQLKNGYKWTRIEFLG